MLTPGLHTLIDRNSVLIVHEVTITCSGRRRPSFLRISPAEHLGNANSRAGELMRNQQRSDEAAAAAQGTAAPYLALRLPNSLPALIEQADFDRVQAKLAKSNPKPKRRWATPAPNAAPQPPSMPGRSMRLHG
ncbi:hypothetical protein ACFFWD_27725 [Bradyrhizobium erythrophlei]|uniref:hypothetical protein n=1 Tax=Bradyrhizobium erythrophlei TaxID=1437360 RepID=UPI0035F0A089